VESFIDRSILRVHALWRVGVVVGFPVFPLRARWTIIAGVSHPIESPGVVVVPQEPAGFTLTVPDRAPIESAYPFILCNVPNSDLRRGALTGAF